MNKLKLKEAEEKFFIKYPGGFLNPLMLEIAKKHKVEKMTKLAHDSFSIDQFEDPIKVIESMSKVVSQSSMISIFEKPKFKDLVKALHQSEKEFLSNGLKEFLHGGQSAGFSQMCDLLNQYKLAKWPLLTVYPVYFRPGVEVFVKPTTAKGIIEFFELKGPKYNSKPTFEFYQYYRDQINQMKAEVDSSLGLDNAAFCGFLLISMESHSL